MSQQNPPEPAAPEDGPDRTGGVGEHSLETPADGDVEDFEGEFGELTTLLEPGGGGQTTPDTAGVKPPDAEDA